MEKMDVVNQIAPHADESQMTGICVLIVAPPDGSALSCAEGADHQRHGT